MSDAGPPAGRPNRRTRQCREQWDAMPEAVRRVAAEKFRLFLTDPSHGSLRHHLLSDAGGLHPRSYSVSITMLYRAVYHVVDGVNVWYFVGTHADYDRLCGKGG